MSDLVYTRIETVPSSAAGATTQIRFSAILCMMQDAAYEHAKRLGVGYDFLIAQKRAFVLSRMQLKVTSELPSWNESVVIQTWPRGLDRLFAYRDFEISREGREPFLKASTAWLMIDTELRHPVRQQEFFVNITPRDVRVLADDAPRKLAWEENTQPFDIRHARASDLDPNGHVNNTRYIDWITDAIAERHGVDAQIDSMCINYHAEVLLGEAVKLGIGEEPDGEIVLQGEAGHRSFASRVRLVGNV
jgi:acyl-ACP thioesterase